MAIMWNSAAEMPAAMRKAAHNAGMWDDDIDHIWFVPIGFPAVEGDRRKLVVEFKAFNSAGGSFFVQYHS